MAELLIGLMSGTSMDAIDAVLVRFEDRIPRLVEHYTAPIPFTVRQELLALTEPGSNELDRMARLDSVMARLFAEAVEYLLCKANIKPSQIQAIGSHGQTIRHMPNDSEPYTIQISNPNLLAELTGIATVADFRRRDMAAGGQGAPLAPAFHAAFFQHPREARVIINIGGMANITVLPPENTPHFVSGFDTGPGNVLLDAWVQRHRGDPIDRNGTWAREGQIIPKLLQSCLNDPYFTLPLPKSTGREYFNLDWLQKKLATLDNPLPQNVLPQNVLPQNVLPQNVQATLVELTARSIAMAIQTYSPTTERILVCGGGVHNLTLMEGLQNHCAGIPVESTAVWGINPDYLEAIGFAWLAKRTLKGLPGNLPKVTGAKGLRILGGIYPA